MRARLFILAALLAGTLQAGSAHAYLNPYVRLSFGGNQLRMNDINDAISADVAPATAAGLPVTAQKVGPGFGPSGSAGLWLVPFLRVGATYGLERSRVNHEYSQPGFLYQDDFTLRLKEVGVEAALRIPALGGLTLGGGTGFARGEIDQTFVLNNIHGNYRQDFTSHGSARTYHAFVGLDQTTSSGVAGFLQVGYHWRQIDPMPGTFQIDDNGTMSVAPGLTPPADYSGWSVRLGCGYDLKW